MTTNLDGAVVAVVGASGGLGVPIARLLAERGARLLLAGRRTDRLAVLVAS
ncbi:MAG: SDR family NAD(P)-dependent oxidoreductase [Acidimicrobiales bacterium]